MQKYTYEPLPGYIVVKRLDDEPLSGGIVLPDSVREKPQRGTVLAVWSTDRNFNETDPVLWLGVGDTVLFRKYGAAEVEVNGEQVLLLEQADVYAILRPDART